MSDKCFCHLNGYKVKDSDARASIEKVKEDVNTAKSTADSAKVIAESAKQVITDANSDVQYVRQQVEAIREDIASGKLGNGQSATHSWNGTVLTVTSASGSSSADLKGAKGDPFTIDDFTPEQLESFKGKKPNFYRSGNKMIISYADEGKSIQDVIATEFNNLGYSGSLELKSVELPKVTSFSKGVFYGCNNINTLIFGKITDSYGSNKRLGWLFGVDESDINNDANKSQEDYIPSSIKTVIITGDKVYDGLLHGCKSVESVTILGNVRALRPYAFKNTGIKSINIPSTLGTYTHTDGTLRHQIFAATFSGCALNEVIIGDVTITENGVTVKSVLRTTAVQDKITYNGKIYVPDDMYNAYCNDSDFGWSNYKSQIYKISERTEGVSHLVVNGEDFGFMRGNDGAPGRDGNNGKDGVSPTVSVTKSNVMSQLDFLNYKDF